jgi:methylated-DNA-[protein]-cysteine S-methyltransferase
MEGLRWWRQATPYGTVTVVASDRGVRAIRLPGETDDPELLAAAEPEPAAGLAAALDAWFSADRAPAPAVPLDLDPCVTGFRRSVLDTLLAEVGWGETVSYGELAAMAGRPGAARAVGGVMASNPVPFVVPCHRVIAAGGRIGGYGGVRGDTEWVDLKRRLLAREGVFPKA